MTSAKQQFGNIAHDLKKQVVRYFEKNKTKRLSGREQSVIYTFVQSNVSH